MIYNKKLHKIEEETLKTILSTVLDFFHFLFCRGLTAPNDINSRMDGKICFCLFIYLKLWLKFVPCFHSEDEKNALRQMRALLVVFTK